MMWQGRPKLFLERAPRSSLTIGLLNNASERARKSTERQFRMLLDAALPDIAVELTCFRDADVGSLFGSRLDALIVTGMEPTARTLPEESVWPVLTKIIDGARNRSLPVLWSCLAAHAAVLYLDGISRTRLPEKLSGVYECRLASPGHLLCAGFPSCWTTPHSRSHDIAEESLIAAGYEILSRTNGHGVDLFAKPCGATFLFAQGHPEYDVISLRSEYRRDVRRYFLGEQGNYPECQNYFDARSESALAVLRAEAMASRDPAILVEILDVLDRAECAQDWRHSAAQLYRNWLFALADGELSVGMNRLIDLDRLSVIRNGADTVPVLAS